MIRLVEHIQAVSPLTQCFTRQIICFPPCACWTDYCDRFCTFFEAGNVPADIKPQVFLKNLTTTIYKLLAKLDACETYQRDHQFMRIQLDNTRFILGEGFKFSNDMKHKPDKSHQPCNMRLFVHHKTHAWHTLHLLNQQ